MPKVLFLSDRTVNVYMDTRRSTRTHDGTGTHKTMKTLTLYPPAAIRLTIPLPFAARVIVWHRA